MAKFNISIIYKGLILDCYGTKDKDVKGDKETPDYIGSIEDLTINYGESNVTDVYLSLGLIPEIHKIIYENL